MMKSKLMKCFALPVALCGFLAMGNALAVGLFIEPQDSPEQTPAINDVLGVVDGFIDAYLYIDFMDASLVRVTFEFLGDEAARNNHLFVGQAAGQESILGNWGASQIGDTASYLHPLGALGNLVDFFFTTQALGTIVADNLFPVGFPNPNDSSTGMGYWLSQAGLMANQAYIGLDDGGAGPDADYDDLMFLVTVEEVPVPATLALMGLGILGLGVRRFRA